MKQDSSFQKTGKKHLFFVFGQNHLQAIHFFIARHLKIVLDYSGKVFYFWNAKNSEVIR